MRRTIFIFIMTFMSCYLFGQLNPINNLQLTRGYEYGNPNCPSYNCFDLSWEEPDSSLTDSLIGYNVYKNEFLWKFIQSTDIACTGIGPCNYPDIYDNIPFWIKIKAVYAAQKESEANDSVPILDLAISITKNELHDFEILINPIIKGNNITVKIPDNIDNRAIIKVINSLGITLEKQILIPGMNIITIPTTKMNSGLYNIVFINNSEIFIKNLMVW